MQTGVVTRGEWDLGQPERVEAPRDAQRKDAAAIASRERVTLATFIALTVLGAIALAVFTWTAVLSYTPLF